MMNCSNCGNQERNISHSIREMQYGQRTPFPYSECSKCGYLEIEKIPENLGEYYPFNYYSFSGGSAFVSFLKGIRCAHSLGKKSVLGNLLVKKFGHPPVVDWLKPVNHYKDARFLDIGCGAGIALQDLRFSNFKALHGVDPFIPADRKIGRVEIKKSSLFDVKEKYDLIMLNHSFEHMDQQQKVFQKLSEIIHPKGTVILRMPIIGDAWRTFKENWYCTDAPRHLSLHSQKSFEIFLERTKFKIDSVVFDGTDHDYLASIQYSKDIPFESENSYIRNPEKSIFKKEDILEAQKRSREANARQEGNQATYYLTLKDSH